MVFLKYEEWKSNYLLFRNKWQVISVENLPETVKLLTEMWRIMRLIFLCIRDRVNYFIIVSIFSHRRARKCQSSGKVLLENEISGQFMPTFRPRNERIETWDLVWLGSVKSADFCFVNRKMSLVSPFDFLPPLTTINETSPDWCRL